VLFNVIIGGTLTSLTGRITGTGWDARMVLRSYDGTTFGPEGLATVQFVPEPSVWVMAVAGIACAGVAARRRRRRGAGAVG
jgi:hypothetical protein